MRKEWKPSAEYELLVATGVPPGDAANIDRVYPADRINQAVKHFHAARQTRALPSDWISNCIRKHWLPILLFPKDIPPDRESIMWRQHLIIGGPKDYVFKVEAIVRRMSKYEFEWLAGWSAREVEDEHYKQLFFRNPTRSNWPLVEKVCALKRKGRLETPEYGEYLARRARNKFYAS